MSRFLHVVGSTGSGKTTLVNAILDSLARLTLGDRVIPIEDTTQLQCPVKNYLDLRAVGNVTMLECLRACMWLKPRRIVRTSCSDQITRHRKWRSAVDTNISSDPQPIESPSGLDLHPEPQKALRISRRASMAIISAIVLLLLAFACGGYRRTLTNPCRDGSRQDFRLNLAPSNRLLCGHPAASLSRGNRHAENG